MEIAIVGIGRVAEQNYIPSLLRHDDVTLICYSRTPERAEEIGQKFRIRAGRYKSYLSLNQRQSLC